jgi:tellurite resistance protein
MTRFLSTLVDGYQHLLERNRNLPFLKATMAACALVATADGNVTFSQRVRVDQILETLDALRVFDPHEGVQLFVRYSDAILNIPRQGHADAVKLLESVKDDAEKAELLVRICLATAEANGKTTLIDQIEIVTLCSLLGLDAIQFGLYKDELLDSLKRGTDS